MPIYMLARCDHGGDLGQVHIDRRAVAERQNDGGALALPRTDRAERALVLRCGQAIAISTDGRGAWRDTVSVERPWRSMKYEEAYLRAYDSVSDARASLGRYLNFYNSRRPHSSLGARTPEQAYLDHMPHQMAA